jgi:hypothetical protein
MTIGTHLGKICKAVRKNNRYGLDLKDAPSENSLLVLGRVMSIKTERSDANCT